ncbi:MAG TPA: hypothetical protein VHL11_22265 [Phototrophicaceae bacterium]|nr:hypothetical protein [Phototrophicaceae bacterium]
MSDEKSKRLQLTLWDVQKRMGQQTLGTLSSLTRADDSIPIATGFEGLDHVLGVGGIPRGQMTELLGIPTSGMTTLAHKMMASVHTAQGITAYIDFSHSFDPDYAVRCGVVLNRLLVVRPNTMTQALDIARDLFREAKLDLVLLDLITEQDASSRTLETVFKRLHEPLTKSRSAAVLLRFASKQSIRQMIDEYIYLRLLVEWEDWLYEQHDVRGYRIQLTVLKHKSQPGERQIHFDITFDDVVKGDGA